MISIRFDKLNRRQENGLSSIRRVNVVHQSFIMSHASLKHKSCEHIVVLLQRSKKVLLEAGFQNKILAFDFIFPLNWTAYCVNKYACVCSLQYCTGMQQEL